MSKYETDTDTEPKRRQPLRWSNDMNLGQLLQGGAVLVAVVGSYYAQALKIERVDFKAERAEMRLGSQQEVIARIEKVTDSLAHSQQSIAQTLAVLTTKVEDRRRIQ